MVDVPSQPSTRTPKDSHRDQRTSTKGRTYLTREWHTVWTKDEQMIYRVYVAPVPLEPLKTPVETRGSVQLSSSVDKPYLSYGSRYVTQPLSRPQ